MAKLPAIWTAQDGSSKVTTTNAGVQRLEQDAVTIRYLQDGVTPRVLQDAAITQKELTNWDVL